ncbi:MAG: hypothetical protein ABSA16_09965 [Thermoguttaceae bacterium]|jgi:hypothetical protein
MNQIKELERLAIGAHRDGELWAAFWQVHAAEIRKAEPYSRQRFKQLVNRLLSLVVSGDLDGQEPPDITEPWLVDDTSMPSDSVTHARCLWPGQSPPPLTTPTPPP